MTHEIKRDERMLLDLYLTSPRDTRRREYYLSKCDVSNTAE